MTQIRETVDSHDIAKMYETDVAIQEAESEYILNGILLEARDTLSALREKYFGKYRELD